MTLNQLIRRIEIIAKSHKQIGYFYYGDPVWWLSKEDERISYPACIVDINRSTIDKEQHLNRYQVEVTLCDLVNVSDGSGLNEVEVFSDLTSVAEDLVSMFSSPAFQNDLTVGESAGVEYFRDKFEDVTAAVKFTIEIATNYDSNRCQVPALEDYEFDFQLGG